MSESLSFSLHARAAMYLLNDAILQLVCFSSCSPVRAHVGMSCSKHRSIQTQVGFLMMTGRVAHPICKVDAVHVQNLPLLRGV